MNMKTNHKNKWPVSASPSDLPSTSLTSPMSSGGMAKTSACPAPADWLTPALLERVERLTLHDLVVVTGTLQKEGHGNISLEVTCTRCGKRKKKWLMNLEKAKDVRCGCHRATDPIRYTLAIRYNAMNQRCNTDTHVSSHNYKGRGIKLEFESREDFIQWALATWPSETFKGKDFDRIDNDGNYSKTNLRLVTRSINHLNRRDSKNSIRSRADAFMAGHPEITYAPITVKNLIQGGLTEEQIVARHAKCPPPEKRKPKSKDPKPETWKSTAEIHAKAGIPYVVSRSPVNRKPD